MITYTKTNFIETLIKKCYNLFDLHIILFALISVSSAYFFTVLNEEVDKFNLTKHATSLASILSVFNFFFATLLSFRLNSAFNSWSNGYNNVCKLVNATKRFMCIVHSKDNDVFMNNIRQSILSYVSHVFYFCAGSNGRSDVDGIRCEFLNQQELYKLDQLNSIVSSPYKKDVLESTLKSTIVLSLIEKDIRRTISVCRAQSVINYLEAENLNVLLNEICLISDTLFNMANIPIVLVYNQFINVTILFYLIVYGMNMAISSHYYSGIWVFIWSSVVFMANNVCNQIDTPFGDEENDIELEIVLVRLKDDIGMICSENLVVT